MTSFAGGSGLGVGKPACYLSCVGSSHEDLQFDTKHGNTTCICNNTNNVLQLGMHTSISPFLQSINGPI